MATGPAVFQRIVETSRYLYVVLDHELRISYASPVCADLLGYTQQEMVGQGPELIHPDDLDVAMGALVQLVSEADGRLGVGIPLSGRVRTKDGNYRNFEIGAQVMMEDPDVGGVILRLRPIEGQAFADRALEALVAGNELDDVLALLADSVSAEVSPARASIAYDWDGERFLHSVGNGLDDVLGGVVALGGGAPWSMSSDEEPFGVPFDDLPDELAAAAGAAGFRACWIVPVAVAGQRHACVIVWRWEDDSPWVSHLVALGRIAQLVTLAFRHRHDAELLVHAALHDGLTGVANRTQFFQRLAEVLAAPTVDGIGVLYLDLDDFKPVNDDHGHAAGDDLLRAVTDRVEANVRPDDLVARLGGDEFAVLCLGVSGEDELVAIAERVVRAIGAPIPLQEVEARVAASVGISFSPAGTRDSTVLERADNALREAKASGKGQWRLAPAPADRV